MKLLLDTCTFLWILEDSPALSPAARALFTDSENEAYLSSVSAWEMTLKHGLGKLSLPESPDRYVPLRRERYRIEPLPLDEESALHLARLPQLHRDPFDRMLICQAMVHGMVILTPDPLVAQYPVRIAW